MHISRLKVTAVALLWLLATACTGAPIQSAGDDTSEAGSETEEIAGTTIKWLIEEPEDAAALKALKEHVADFEEESGVTVKTTTLDFQNMRTVLQTQLRSGEGPDVFNWGSGPSFGGALAEAGLLYDLTGAYEEHGWDVYDFAKERVTTDGKVYGIPGEMETIGIFYNQKIFDDVGVEPPTTLDELKSVSEKIKGEGIIPMAVGNKEGWEGGHLLSMSLSSAIGSERMEGLFTGDESWDSPEVVSSVEFWREANDKGWLPKSPTSVDYDTSIAMFFSGEAAMIPTGSWLVGEIDDNMDVEVGYIPFPAPEGEAIFAGGLGSGPFVSATAENKAAAVAFLDFLASEEHGQWTVENLHTIPPQPIDTEGLDVSPLFAQVLEDISSFSEGGDFGYNIDVMVSDAFNEAMYDGMQGVMTGQSTPEDVAADLQAAAEK